MTRSSQEVYKLIPKLGQLRDDVVFGDIWQRENLSKRDRSLITIAVLATLQSNDEMHTNIDRALLNGITVEEITELIIHIAFYAGWPAALNAGRVALDVFAKK